MMSDLFDKSDMTIPPFTIPTGSGYRVVPNLEWNGFDISVPNGQIFYAENFFKRTVADRTLVYLQENDSVDWRGANWRDFTQDALENIRFKNILWKQDWITFYGKRIPLPRLTSWYGDPGRTYAYSGIKSEPNMWNEGLIYLRDQIEKCAGVAFNSVLLNWYRDGDDHLSWHSDDEKELGLNPVIASANFGASRDFIVRRVSDHSQKIIFPLKHGTLLVMKGELQHHWEHSVPKRKSVRQPRFNMTFRRLGLSE